MVTIFDNIYVTLTYLIQLLVQVVSALRQLPNIIHNAGLVLARFQSCFPPFLWFLVMFAFGAGILTKLLHWGS